MSTQLPPLPHPLLQGQLHPIPAPSRRAKTPSSKRAARPTRARVSGADVGARMGADPDPLPARWDAPHAWGSQINGLPCVALASWRRCGFTRSRSRFATIGSRPSSCSTHTTQSRHRAHHPSPRNRAATGQDAGQRKAARASATARQPPRPTRAGEALPSTCPSGRRAGPRERCAPGRGPACFRQSIAGPRPRSGRGRCQCRPWRPTSPSPGRAPRDRERFARLPKRRPCTPSARTLRVWRQPAPLTPRSPGKARLTGAASPGHVVGGARGPRRRRGVPRCPCGAPAGSHAPGLALPPTAPTPRLPRVPTRPLQSSFGTAACAGRGRLCAAPRWQRPADPGRDWESRW